MIEGCGAMTVSVAVMAHPARARFIPYLLDRLDVEPVVVWDEKGSAWDTGRRALLTHDPGAAYHVVLQDDVLICRDLVAGVQLMLTVVPAGLPLGLYMGAQRAGRGDLARERGWSWVVQSGPFWGPGIVVPTADIARVVERGDRMNIDSYDHRVFTAYAGMPCWHPMPSIVDHRDTPSLMAGHGFNKNRHAHWFIGEDASALDVDWSRTPRSDEDMDDGYVRALLTERARHAERGRPGRVAQVDEELRRIGREDLVPSKPARQPLETTAQAAPPEDTAAERPAPYKCECGREFRSASGLTRHRNTTHEDSDGGES